MGQVRINTGNLFSIAIMLLLSKRDRLKNLYIIICYNLPRRCVVHWCTQSMKSRGLDEFLATALVSFAFLQKSRYYFFLTSRLRAVVSFLQG